VTDEQRATLTAREVCELTGVSRNTLYESLKTGNCPFPVLRIGRRLVFPARPLYHLLGLDGEGPDGEPDNDGENGEEPDE
jgi:excisionase family DNA binding protein